jgi:hypothetical protein
VRPPRTDKTNITAYTRPFIATALLAGGLVQLAAPAFAQVVTPAANTSISNTATATYTDPNDTNNIQINTVSNTVTISVAKVAGITVTANGFNQTGLSPTGAYKPGEDFYSNFTATNTGNDGVKFQLPKTATVTNAAVVQVEYSTDGINWQIVNDTHLLSPIVAVGGTLQVRIRSTISTGAAAGAPLTTILGNSTNTSLASALRGNGGLAVTPNDIFTYDVQTPTPGSVTLGGYAANGTVEASASQTVNVNAAPKTFASIKVTNGTDTTNGATKDDLQYNIAVTVPTLDTATGLTGTDLAPTAISLSTKADGSTPTSVNRVIISDPLPTGTTLTSEPTAPTGSAWTVVYSTTPLGTTPVWSVVRPASLTSVTQVGFIYEPTTPTIGTSTLVAGDAGTSLPASITPYSGFSVTLTTGGLGTITNTVSVTGLNTNGDKTTGAILSPTSSVDTKTTRTAVIGAISNGPVNTPAATGPTGSNNDDYTNKSMTLTSADGASYDSSGVLRKTASISVVTFSNSIQNNTNVAGTVYLEPALPTNYNDLPSGTIVKIKDGTNTITRTYKYTITDTTGAFATTDGTTTPLSLPLGASAQVGYAVDVTLPAGINQLTGYPVTITAFTSSTVPTSPTNVPVGALTNNTIDRVYTGYINLVKEARLIGTLTDTTTTYASGTLTGAVPGKYIQYRIRAVNVSKETLLPASGNFSLSATNINMVEDGASGGNNWAATTSHVAANAKTFLGTTEITSTSTIKYDGAASPGTTVSKYDVNLGTATVAPNNGEASFTFVRQVNKAP